MSILHFIPENVFSRTEQGSYKDVASRVEQFENAGYDYRQIRLRSDAPEAIADSLRGILPRAIFIEYSYYPKILSMLRRKFATAIIAVRAHNAEPLQNFADRGLSPISQIPRTFYGSMRLLAGDYQVRQKSDIIYAINDWEIKNYWRFIPGPARLAWLPYYAPPFVIPTCRSSAPNLVICLPNKSVNRKSRDLVSRFCDFASIAKKLRPELTFAITRNPEDWGVQRSRDVEIIGYQEDLRELMSSVIAVAVLSPMGFGFKTTIMDAIAAGAWVIIDQRLYQRIPRLVQSSCIPIGRIENQEVSNALERLTRTAPLNNINDRLRERAQQILLNGFIK